MQPARAGAFSWASALAVCGGMVQPICLFIYFLIKTYSINIILYTVSKHFPVVIFNTLQRFQVKNNFKHIVTYGTLHSV